MRVLVVGLLLGVVGCTSTSTENRPSPVPTQSTPSTASTASTPTVTTPSAEPHPVSLQALMKRRYDGRDLRAVRVITRNDAYTRYFATYKSGSLTISGILNVPTGRGPFPVLVLNHGYIDPAIYTNGRGLAREQDYLARNGFVVLHTDYRNHAQSDDDAGAETQLRLGYTIDVINAVHAIKRSSLPYLDRNRIALLGRSMGGGITYNALVAQPGLVDAAVVYAPVSSDAVDNFNRWIRNDSARGNLATAIIKTYGAPERNPAFWRNLSARNFFGRITEPILIQHGTADESCPIAWSRTTLAALQREGKNATMYTYPGEHHAFGPAHPLSMRRTVAFLRQHLR